MHCNLFRFYILFHFLFGSSMALDMVITFKSSIRICSFSGYAQQIRNQLKYEFKRGVDDLQKMLRKTIRIEFKKIFEMDQNLIDKRNDFQLVGCELTIQCNFVVFVLRFFFLGYTKTLEYPPIYLYQEWLHFKVIYYSTTASENDSFQWPRFSHTRSILFELVIPASL